MIDDSCYIQLLEQLLLTTTMIEVIMREYQGIQSLIAFCFYNRDNHLFGNIAVAASHDINHNSPLMKRQSYQGTIPLSHIDHQHLPKGIKPRRKGRIQK